MLPPVSDPNAPKARPAATATPEPEEDTPGQWSRCQGLRGGSTSRMVGAEGALRELRLADDHRTRLAQAAHRRGILLRNEIRHDLGAARRGQPRRLQQVLHRHRHAVQQPQGRPAAPLAILRLGGLKRFVRRHHGERPQIALQGLNAGKQRFGDLNRSELAALDAAAGIGKAVVVQAGHVSGTGRPSESQQCSKRMAGRHAQMLLALCRLATVNPSRMRKADQIRYLDA